MNWTKLLLIALIFPFTCTAAIGQTTEDCQTIPIWQQIALVQIYIATDGPNWDNSWDINNTPACQWHGVKITNGVVTSLNLNNNNLTGSLPTSWLSLLSSLETLNLYENQLEGTIPASIGSLKDLKTLNLSYNNFRGEIPATICNLTNLTALSFNTNQLEGAIPSCIGELNSLITLDFSNNILSGELPAEVGMLENLFVLSLSNNAISGAIPDELGTLHNLRNLNLSNNQLSDTIPETLLGLINIYELNLDNNQLTGAIPLALTQIPSLGILVLSNNQLSGNIPAELVNLVNLKTLILDNNLLDGELPEELGYLNFLTTFSVNNNSLSGCFPQSYIVFCNAYIDFSSNSGLPNDGDFNYFCTNPDEPCNQQRQQLIFELTGADWDCYSDKIIDINILQGTSPFMIRLEQNGLELITFPASSLNFPLYVWEADTFLVTITDANGLQATEQLVIATDCQIVGDEIASSRSRTSATTNNFTELAANKSQVEVFANYPNPFTQGTTLPFTLSATQELSIRVVNATGQQVYQLNQTFEAGIHQLQLQENIFRQAGLYIYHVQYGDKLVSGKLMKL